MKDYRKDRTKEKDYILGAKQVTKKIHDEDGEFEVVDELHIKFADKKEYTKIAYSAENIQKVIEVQEQQAAKGVKNLPIFEKRKTLAGIMTGAAIIGGPVIGAGLNELAEQALQMEDNPLRFAISVGAFTLGAVVPGVYSLIKNGPVVKELRKLKYRNEHREELDNYQDYPNATVGLSAKKAKTFEYRKTNEADPFSVAFVDEYTQADLETIVGNIEREKKFGFTYVKTPTGSKK